MAPFLFPNLEKGQKSTKGLIVDVLSEEWPLSAKKIFNRINALSKYSFTYQAVYKSLNELLEAKVLQREGNSYSLSVNWIGLGCRFFEDLDASYKKDFVKGIEGKTFMFETLYATDRFLIECLYKLGSLMPKRPVLCLHWNHLWIPLFISMDYYNNLKELGKMFRGYSLVKGNDSIDKWCADFWNKTGMKSKTGVPVASPFDLVIVGDFVIQVLYSSEIKASLDEVYSKTREVKNLDLDKFFHSFFEKKTTVLLKVIVDSQLSEELKHQTISWFK